MAEDKRKIAAVVVTYNRLDKLKTVLRCMEEQTRLPEQLIIVNNAATDGTDQYLAEYKANFKFADKIQLDIVTLPTNEGGAGGFSAGMRRSYELGADFAWIFDDDGYPEPDALEKLVDGYDAASAKLGTNIPFACSLVKFIDGNISEMNNPMTTWDWGRLMAQGLNIALVSRCSFVSVLIPRWVMESYGLPYKEYFIWFDDAEYTIRITDGCPGIQVMDSVVLHDMGSNKGVNYSMIDEKNIWKFEYGARNEGSYHLHHEGMYQYLRFCAMVMNHMRRGGVAKPLQKRIYKKLIEAWNFNPKIDYPQVPVKD
ncbi:GT2 family glycosyltransferase [Bifidobacterium commune]|uniref:Glycosyltransferase, GT2 family n=1 Tax=Bifidobacterium commune TaxID=1505727 RepID=A0A1C4H6I6_9BIFI|nr:glycosyltransferase family 2 protein [Bifidobacterium commune]MBB2955431.1 GT2 family glycosyltransferase [Bifidobacterium commune]SCC80566.1 Glycosyltransferase, GT2 family [Bifidobacterium commune]